MELLFLLCFIAAWTCVVVSDMLVVCSLIVLCLTVLVNCLLNAFALSMGELNVFSLKVIVLCCWLIRVWSSRAYVCCRCVPW